MMEQNVAINRPNSKASMIAWIRNSLNKPPFPISPQQSLLQNREPKQPAYYDGKYYKPLEWKRYQNWHDLDPTLRKQLVKNWHEDCRIEGVSTLGGWNGEHWLGWIDFDQGDFPSGAAMAAEIDCWLERYPLLKEAPHFTTPSGGHRFLVAWEQEPAGFGANNGFTLTPGSNRMGELLTRNGGHTLLPPTRGTNGKAYEWVTFAEYPPVVESPLAVGLVPAKAAKNAPQRTERQKIEPAPPGNNRAWESFLDSFHLPTGEEIPLEICLAPNHRDLIQWGVREGERDNTAAAIARDLLGTADYLNQIGQQFDGHPRKLLEQFCQNCNPPLSEADLERIWKSAQRARPSPCLREDKIKNCIAAHFWKNGAKQEFNGQRPGRQTSTKPVNPPHCHPIASEVLLTEIEELIGQDLPPSQVRTRLNQLAQTANLPISETWKLYREQLSELERREARETTKQEIDNLLAWEQHQLDLEHYLPVELAQPLVQIADLLGSTSLALLTILLPTVATLINPDTQLELIQGTNFYAKPILFSGIVAESGSAKSPTLKAILDPFKRLQYEADREYQEKWELYQAQLSEWKKQKKTERGESPEEPIPKEYFINDFTAEAVSLIQSQQPNKGLLMEFDELSALVNAQNAYRGGKGSDAEKILSGRDGTGIKVNRASGKRLANPRSTFSITGGIQRDTLRSQMGDLRDSRGHWARFIWAVLPILEAKFPDEEPTINVSEMLYGLYQTIEALPAVTYTLDSQARQLYGDWFRTLETKKMTEPNQALRAVYSKFKRTTGELALLLHTIWSAFYQQQPSLQVGPAMMELAISLSQVYIGQVRLIYGEAEAEHGELSPLLKKLIELSQRRGELTASLVKNFDRSLRKMSPNVIRSHFRELEALGYGSTQGEGRNLRWSIRKIDKNRQKIDKASSDGLFSESLSQQELQPLNRPENRQIDKIDTQTTVSMERSPLDRPENRQIDKIDTQATASMEGYPLESQTDQVTYSYTDSDVYGVGFSVTPLPRERKNRPSAH